MKISDCKIKAVGPMVNFKKIYTKEDAGRREERMQWERGHKNKEMVKESPLMVAKVAQSESY